MKIKSYIYYLVIVILMASCSEVVDVDLPQAADKVVIEGYVTNQQDSSYISLTKSVSYYSLSPIPKITNAFVMVNSDTFFHTIDGIYKPHSPYSGVPGVTYNLKVKYEGNEYTAISTLNELIKIDSVFTFLYHEKELIAPEGYSISFNFTFANPNQYTYFRDGFKNDLITKGRDSIYGQVVTFDSKNAKYGMMMPFDVPFLRLQPNDTALLYFRSCDLNAFNYYNAINESSRSGSPFSTPPANLPTNIRGGAIGFFAAQEVRNFRIRIKP